MKKTFLTCAVLVGAAFGAHAQQAAVKTFYPLIGGGLTFGGDQIGNDIQFEDGGSQSVSAGGTLDMRVGLEYAPVGLPLTFQISVGYHTGGSFAASNGNASFHRIPLELLTHYKFNETWRAGFGVRKTSNAESSASGAARGYVPSQKYESDVGFIAEVEYFVTPQFGIKARGVSEKYKPELSPHTEVDGSHFGVLAVYYFK